jgi:hypothetical protein
VAILDNYVIIFSILATLVFIFRGYGFGGRLIDWANLSYILLYFCLFGNAVYLLLLKKIKIDKKMFLWNFIWIIPWYAILVFLNQFGIDYFGTGNHFYTRIFSSIADPFAFFYHWFDGAIIKFKIDADTYELNFLYYLGMLLLSGSVGFMTAWVGENIQNHHCAEWLRTKSLL